MKKLFSIIFTLSTFGVSAAYATPHNTNTSSSSATGGSSAVKVNSTNVVLPGNGYGNNNTFNGMNWNNDNGFGTGVYCRTPSFFLGGSANPVTGAYGETTGHLNDYNVSAGVMVPFGSRSLEDCKNLAAEITRQRKIDGELSTLRACAEVKRLGIVPDVKKYPNLAACVN